MDNDTAMGYVIKSMEDEKFSPEDIQKVLRSMQDNFDMLTEGEMKNYYLKKIGKYWNL